MLDKNEVRQKLDLVINGLLTLKNNSDYDEPNLDGSPSDYISFESWEWPQGVGMYGLWRYIEYQDNPKLLKWLEDWYQRRFEEGLPSANVNTTAPMLALSFLYEKTGNTQYKEILVDWANNILNHFPRTQAGGFQHIVSDGINPEQLWDDTLFMVVLFMAKLGSILNRTDLQDEAIYQFLLHTKYLTDTKTELWYHGWDFNNKNNFSCALWGRGNAWISAGILDFIDILDMPFPIKRYLLSNLKRQMHSLLKLQSSTAMWHTLLDDPTSYEETSATSGFSYAFLKAFRLNLVGKEYQDAGLNAVAACLNQIDDNGIVQNVSYGTRMGTNLQFYKDIPIEPMAYGQSLMILQLVEALHHL